MTIRWAGSGLIILGALAGFVFVSNGYGSPRLHLPLYVAAAVVHLAAVVISRPVRASRSALLFAVVLGLLLRLVVCLTPESREGDYYRYMWDGALAAHGISPYRYSPAQVLKGEVSSPVVRRLSQDGHAVLTRINHPELRTLYPPAAQSLFALGYWIGPFNSTAWRAVLLFLDVSAGLLILFLVRSAGRPVSWSISYLWNPLLIVETYHYRHLDLALAPFLLLFLWGLWKQRPYLAACGLATATAIKIWPALLVPMLAVRFSSRRPLFVKATLAFFLLVAVLFLPYWASVRSSQSSGTVAYAKTWNANELVFRGIHSVASRLQQFTGHMVDERILSRTIFLLLLVGVTAWLALVVRTRGVEQLASAVASVILLMILAGPTVYPWYFVPAMALSPVIRRPAFLFWAPLLILTYLSRSTAHSNWLLVMVHLPAWFILILQVRELHRPGID